MHEGKRTCEFNDHQQQADATQVQNIAEQEARAQEHDARLQPEFIGGDSGLEYARNAKDVGDDKADDDGPKNIFDIGKRDVVRFGVSGY